jgi:acyl carrier protein
MTGQELFDGVQGVFRSVFEDEGLIIRREMQAADVPGWDSFAHVNLIVALEMHFGVTFPLSEVAELTCVGDVIDTIARKVGVDQ